MATTRVQSIHGLWGVVRRQHGVVAYRQLTELGYSPSAIRHRVARGRLHRVGHDVFAVGRPELTRLGRWMAAVLCCGEGAVLSHGSAAALMGFGTELSGLIEVSVAAGKPRRHAGLRVHRRANLGDSDRGSCRGIPVAGPTQTLIDLAERCDRMAVERMVDEADRLDLISPEALREALADHRGEPGVARLRTWLDRRTFRLTRSHLERLFVPLASSVGLPPPETKSWVNGYEVDFHWPDLKLVVETDSLRYHRTPAQQTRDHERDQAHALAGYGSLRFTHEQVRFEPEQVRFVLAEVVRRLGAESRGFAK